MMSKKNKDIEVRVEETVKVIQGKEYEVHQHPVRKNSKAFWAKKI